MPKPKLIRITTVPLSLQVLLKGQLAFMAEHFQVLAVSAGPQKALEMISEREGVATHLISMTRAITPIADLKALWELYRLLKKEKPVIVHTHTPKAGIIGMLAAKLAGIPHRLHTVAGLPLMEASGKKRWLLNKVEKLTYSCATKVYPNSKGLYDFILQEKFTTAGKLRIIAQGSSNGINTQHFNPQVYNKTQNLNLRKKLNIQEEDFVFVFVGRLVGDKGINELVDAFKSLYHLERSRETRLLLVGPYETELDPLKKVTLQEINTNPNIISVGYQEDVRPYFAISNALVFPSYREGFPNVVLQAGAMGLPSIVTNINGCNEIVKQDENGLIIPPKNVQALQNAMQKIASDKILYQNLQKNARPLICNRFEQHLVWEALLEEYESLLETRD
ncbi:glycosyltransferase family 4 protein [Haloflavibacter putidus]|uniref:Glycosyltransferase family 4 protein n=1 Tax=Haloflavibacter putidus TaxID=2576776 RepID=A0A507Z9X5_9FLAO|nr:glycosyltransferase family 4 protein [Haloflavibacter putidus]TQD33491.1 glycosyltransferase family 4 protein [Haloflavibacter putidus]